MDKKIELVKSMLEKVVFPIVEEIAEELKLNEAEKYQLKIEAGKLAIRLLLDIEVAKDFLLNMDNSSP